MAKVVRVVVRTGGRGRLLELSVDDGRQAALLAAAANVIVHPRGSTAEVPKQGGFA